MISSTKMTTEGSKGVGKVGCKSKTGPTGGSMQPLSMGPTTKKNTEIVMEQDRAGGQSFGPRRI